MTHSVEAERGAAEEAGHDFGWALATLLRSYLKSVEEAVQALPGGPRAYQVLSTVAAGSCQNQAGMAEHLGLDRTVMTHLVDGLEAQKLVKRTPDPLDRRGRRVNLTPRGEKLLAELTARVGDVERRLLAHLSQAEADDLKARLSRAAHVADRVSGGQGMCSLAESIRAIESVCTGEDHSAPTPQPST